MKLNESFHCKYRCKTVGLNFFFLLLLQTSVYDLNTKYSSLADYNKIMPGVNKKNKQANLGTWGMN